MERRENKRKGECVVCACMLIGRACVCACVLIDCVCVHARVRACVRVFVCMCKDTIWRREVYLLITHEVL